MTDAMIRHEPVEDLTIALAKVCDAYDLNAKEFCNMLEAIDKITPEQKHDAIITCTAFAVKDMIENKLKS